MLMLIYGLLLSLKSWCTDLAITKLSSGKALLVPAVHCLINLIFQILSKKIQSSKSETRKFNLALQIWFS